jgi:hypothetical protein
MDILVNSFLGVMTLGAWTQYDSNCKMEKHKQELDIKLDSMKQSQELFQTEYQSKLLYLDRLCSKHTLHLCLD